MANFSISPFPLHNISHFSSDFSLFTPKETWVLSTLVAVVSFLGTTGNLLVIVSILNQDMNSCLSDNPTNLLLLSQAIADLLVSCASGPAFILNLHKANWDVLSTSLGQFTGAASVGNLVLLTLNRFVSIRSSLKYIRMITPSRTKVAIAFNWAISLIFGILTVAGYCANVRKIIGILRFYITPSFFVIAGCYMYMYIKARYHQQKIKKASYRATGQQAGLEKDLKSVFSLLFVTGTFFVTWTPFIIFSFVPDQKDDLIRYNRILYVLLSMILLNSAVDPIIYYFRSPKFRQALRSFSRRYGERRIVRCRQKRQCQAVMYIENHKISCRKTPTKKTELETVGTPSVLNRNSFINVAALAGEYSSDINDDNSSSQFTVQKIQGFHEKQLKRPSTIPANYSTRLGRIS